jgi:hypothetical protein
LTECGGHIHVYLSIVTISEAQIEIMAGKFYAVIAGVGAGTGIPPMRP